MEFLCRCSFLEIYNEQIFDLLDPASIGLSLREDIKKGVFVDGLLERDVGSARDAYRVGWITFGSLYFWVGEAWTVLPLVHGQTESHTNYKCAPGLKILNYLYTPWLKKIIWVIGVLRRTVVSDWRFDNLCGSHLQSQVVVLVSWKFKNPGERFDWSNEIAHQGFWIFNWLTLPLDSEDGFRTGGRNISH